MRRVSRNKILMIICIFFKMAAPRMRRVSRNDWNNDVVANIVAAPRMRRVSRNSVNIWNIDPDIGRASHEARE